MSDKKEKKDINTDFDAQQNKLSRESEISLLHTTIIARTEALNIVASVLSAGLLLRKNAGDTMIPNELKAMQQAVDAETKKTEEMFDRLKQLCNNTSGKTTK